MTSVSCSIELPEWVAAFVGDWSASLEDIEDRMRLAIALSGENVTHGTGGPFGAVVFDLTGKRLLGAGINLVTYLNLSCAHAEMVAISLAQRALNDWNLAATGAVELVTSCEPCAMCYGAIPWSGVSRLVYGANKAVAESAGFDEGDKPGDWEQALERRGIEVKGGILADEAARVFDEYRRSGGVVYNP